MREKKRFVVRTKDVSGYMQEHSLPYLAGELTLRIQHMQPVVAYTEKVEKNEVEFLRTITGTIELCSIHPDDREWMDRHCPDWEEHFSLMPFNGDVRVSEQVLWDLKRDPRVLTNVLKEIRSELIWHLATEIIDHMEPKLKGLDPNE